MKPMARHVIGWLLVLTSICALTRLLSAWLGGPWAWGTLDLWLILDRATILSSFLLTSIAVYTAMIGLRKDGWLRRLLPSARQHNDTNAEVIEDTRILIMLYHNSKTAKDVIEIFGNSIDMLILIASKETTKVEQAYLTAEGFMKHVKSRFAKVVCEKCYYIDDQNDLKATQQQTMTAIHHAAERAKYAAYDASKITCELTGATKPMSFGMMEAAEANGVLAVYTATDRSAGDQVIAGSHRFVVIHARQQSTQA